MNRTDKLILGTVQFGLPYGINNPSGMPDYNEVSAILTLAHESGITLLDTAEAYGVSQEVIGRYHNEQPFRFEVITKFDHRKDLISQDITERVETDLSILSVKQLYAYMFHSFADYKNYSIPFESQLTSLQKRGVIQKVGVSIYTNEEMAQVIEKGNVQLIQLPFNLLDNFAQRGQLIRKAKERGIEVHTRSVFLQGLFFMEDNTLPSKLAPLSPYLKALRNMAGSLGTSIQALALNYAVQSIGIDKVLIGTEKRHQLEANISALNQFIHPSLMKEIDELVVASPELLNPVNWKA